MIVLGVDPGKNGGFAWWENGTMEAVKIHETEKDISDQLRYFSADYCGDQTFAYIEKVHSMPGQGVSSMFTFGRGYGFLRGCLIAHGIPFEEVTPRTWLTTFGLKRGKTEAPTAWKYRQKAKAQQLFPHMKVTHATADAILIAEYGRRLVASRSDP